MIALLIFGFLVPCLDAVEIPPNCTITADGTACVVPYYYGGKNYGACIKADNDGTPWCPTSVSEFGAAKVYGSCDTRCTDPEPMEPESCKTLYGFECAPEFHYNNVVYSNTCTMADDSKAWCAITVYNDTLEANRYGYCNDNCTVAPSPSGCVTTSGQNCKLPFSYNGVSYDNCTDVDNGNTPWCATSFQQSTNKAKGWGNCNSTRCSICNVEMKQIKSLNYPNLYNINLNETWTLQVEEGYRIKVKFLAFVLEDEYDDYDDSYDEDCFYDTLTIIDKSTSTKFGPYCGDEIPEDVISESNQLEVQFISDERDVKTGFLASIIRICI